jgi:hypothetical protein
MSMSEEPPEQSEEEEPEEKERNLITAMKVVQIMQVISEDLGNKEKIMWQKMLGDQSKSEHDKETT